MPEQTFVVTRVMPAPVEHVWEVLTDLNNLSRRLGGVQAVAIMTSGPYAVGTRWRETRTFFGRSATEEMWVRSNDPLRRTVIESDQQQVHYRTVWELTEGEGTRLTMTFTGTSPDGGMTALLSRLVGPIGLRATRKAVERDLDDFEAAAVALRSR
ncbi:MAG: SRPBCC family protein [Ornithinimicrobium sp.]